MKVKMQLWNKKKKQSNQQNLSNQQKLNLEKKENSLSKMIQWTQNNKSSKTDMKMMTTDQKMILNNKTP